MLKSGKGRRQTHAIFLALKRLEQRCDNNIKINCPEISIRNGNWLANSLTMSLC
jgi:hypothetical protein